MLANFGLPKYMMMHVKRQDISYGLRLLTKLWQPIIKAVDEVCVFWANGGGLGRLR